jgi:hypothetical protein
MLEACRFRDIYDFSALIFLDAESKVCIKYDVLYEKMDGDKEVDGHKKSQLNAPLFGRQTRQVIS